MKRIFSYLYKHLGETITNYKDLIFSLIITIWFLSVLILIFPSYWEITHLDSSEVMMEEGTSEIRSSKFGVDLTILSINHIDGSSNVNLYIRESDGGVDNVESTTKNINLNTLQFGPYKAFGWGWEYILPTSNPKFLVGGEMEYWYDNDVNMFPYDVYNYTFRFKNLSTNIIFGYDDLRINETYLEIECGESQWQIFNFNTSFYQDEYGNILEVKFSVKRKPIAIIFEFVIPLVILIGIFYTAISTHPLSNPSLQQFLENQNKGTTDEPKNIDITSSEFKDKLRTFQSEISDNRKFRIDTAKWILAFSIANIAFLNNQKYIFITFWSYIATIALTFSVIFYITSRYQGNKPLAYLNYFSALGAFAIIVLIVIQIIFPIL